MELWIWVGLQIVIFCLLGEGVDEGVGDVFFVVDQNVGYVLVQFGQGFVVGVDYQVVVQQQVGFVFGDVWGEQLFLVGGDVDM